MGKKKKEWTMPAWMEKYRPFLDETAGGNTVEELMNGHSQCAINLPLALLEVGMEHQTRLLFRLHKEGHIQ